jgi:hypothetical protein
MLHPNYQHKIVRYASLPSGFVIQKMAELLAINDDLAHIP